MKNTLPTTIFVFIFSFSTAYAQLEVGAELRPRMEYRHGYRTLSERNEQGIFLTTQRSRLNVGFTKDRIKGYVSLQDLRVWGQDREGIRGGEVGLYEGWFQWYMQDRLYLKLGRQEIEYDDSRLISTSNWRVQGRSHDAALLGWLSRDSTVTVEASLAFNADQEALFKDFYEVSNYKNMQILWINKSYSSGEISLIGMRLGNQLADSSIAYYQTTGVYGSNDFGSLYTENSYYYQFGDDEGGNQVSAHFLSLLLGTHLNARNDLSVGLDFLTGSTSQSQLNGMSNKNGSFNPVFARRHRHFGTQDMFYAGGFDMPAGLVDYHLKYSHAFSSGLKFNGTWHFFQTHTELVNLETNQILADKYLGQEIDLTLNYKVQQDLSVELGYNQYFASSTMEVLKGRGDRNSINNYAYLAFLYKPFFRIASIK